MASCDIVFHINGEDIVMRDSSLSSDTSTLEKIALLLKKDRTFLKKITDVLEKHLIKSSIDDGDLIQRKVVANATVDLLKSNFPYLDWEGLDLGLELYIGESWSPIKHKSLTISLNDIIIIDPEDDKLVYSLYQYLKTRKLIEESEEIYSSPILQKLCEDFPKLLAILKADLISFTLLLPKVEKILEDIDLAKETYKDNKKAFKEAEKTAKSLLTKEEWKTWDRIKNKSFKLLNYSILNPLTLLQEFIKDLNTFKDIFHQGVSYYSTLSNIVKYLQGKVVNEYRDGLTNQINSLLEFNISSGLSEISEYDLKTLFDLYMTTLDTKSDLYKLLKKNPLLGASNSDKKMEWLILVFLHTDSEFCYKPSGVYKPRRANFLTFTFQHGIQTFGEKYGDFNLNLLHLMEKVEKYKGYNIYKYTKEGKTVYVYDKGILSEFSYATNNYKSIADCKKLIDDKIKYEKSYKSHLYELHIAEELSSVYMPNRFHDGQIIETIGILLDKNQEIIPEERKFLFGFDSTLKDFYTYCDLTFPKESQRIKSVVDSNEAMGIFINLINRQRTLGKTNFIDEVLNLIQEGKKNPYYYIVEKSSGLSKGRSFGNKYIRTEYGIKTELPMYQTRFIPIDLSKINNKHTVDIDSTTKRNIAAIESLRKLSTKLKEKFNVNSELLSLSELQEKFPKLLLQAGTKAFILNGTIYINTSEATGDDVLHEYAHLFAGVLKSLNYDNYQKLVLLVAEKSLFKKRQLQEIYFGYADLDINEEVFAEIFGEYLANRNIDKFLSSELKMSKKYLIDSLKRTIFTKETDTDFDFFNDKSVYTILDNVTNDLELLMKEENGLEIPTDASQYRKVTEWIRSVLSDENNDTLIENCDL